MWSAVGPQIRPCFHALLESHAAIEANEIYTKLKTARTADGIPAPSLANVNQGLNDLLRIHSGAAFVGYSRMEDALRAHAGMRSASP